MPDIDTKRLESLLTLVGIASIFAGLAWYLRSSWGREAYMPLLGVVPWWLWSTLVVSFLLGFAFLPLTAMLTQGALWGTFTEPVATKLLQVAALAYPGHVVLEQTETNEYVLRPAEGDLRPESYWTKWIGRTFGITFEATREAFQRYLATAEQRREIKHAETFGNGGVASIGERGGKSNYVTESDASADLLVNIGRALSPLRKGGGPAIVTETYAEAQKEHGDDTSGMSNLAMAAFWLLFLIAGVVAGWIGGV